MPIQGNLVLNPEFETLDPGVPVFTEWDDSVVGGGVVAANAVDQRFGVRCLDLSTGAGPGDDAQVITSAHMPVDRTVAHMFRFNYATVAGLVGDFTASIVQYNALGADLLADIDVTPAASAVWAVSRTTIAALALDANCTQVDIRLLVDVVSNQWRVDMVSLAPLVAPMAAFGTSLYLNGLLVGELTNITGGASGETVDVSSHDSPAAALNAPGFREFVAGMRAANTVSFVGNAYPANLGQVELFDRLSDGDAVLMDIFYPSAVAEWTLNGLAAGIEHSAPYDDKLSFSGSVQVSGVPILRG